MCVITSYWRLKRFFCFQSPQQEIKYEPELWIVFSIGQRVLDTRALNTLTLTHFLPFFPQSVASLEPNGLFTRHTTFSLSIQREK